ncbi:SDR family NAD(P)-dependent oxidoreductase [uncultured Ferrovibrio sp.]|jgi:3-oxoacyl-[acyl-carrier protein] reductase|uniref:SDR family NAD(P)-dependent oxidoreductase n=1 Tax=uncultured Ferrovibrio sp. TaxID=1576913 RepID=UPI00260C5E2A|nr:SDR family NAD(P)-dependent oxidoreductase [uncultured Ferrovibrio sp.]
MKNATVSGSAEKTESVTRLALLTGGARGIGAAIAQRLAADGLTVIIADLEIEAAQATAAALPGKGHAALRLDVSVESEVEALFDRIEAERGPISVLVCNAGILILPGGQRLPIWETSLDDWEKTHAVNARGTFLCCRAYLRRRVKTPVEHGRIVTLGSVAAQLGGYRSSSAYIASKAGVLGFTKAAAREAAPYGITVNAVAPGVIDAPMLRQSLSPEGDAAMAAAIPLNRLGTPEDVASAVGYLVSPAAGYLTGVTIDVNGGYRMQ